MHDHLPDEDAVGDLQGDPVDHVADRTAVDDDGDNVAATAPGDELDRLARHGVRQGLGAPGNLLPASVEDADVREVDPRVGIEPTVRLEAHGRARLSGESPRVPELRFVEVSCCGGTDGERGREGRQECHELRPAARIRW